MGKLERARIHVLKGDGVDHDDVDSLHRGLLQPEGVLARQVGRVGRREGLRRRAEARVQGAQADDALGDAAVRHLRGAHQRARQVGAQDREADDDDRRAAEGRQKRRAKDKQKFRPPTILFIWGRFIFKGVVESLSQKYTMFLSDGTPVRAECALKIRNVIDKQDRRRQEPDPPTRPKGAASRTRFSRAIGSISSPPRSSATPGAGPRSPPSTTSSMPATIAGRRRAQDVD